MTGYISFLSSGFFSKIGTFLRDNLLSSGNDMTAAEKLSFSGMMVLRGMATVFLVLITLWVIIAIFGAVAKLTSKKETSAPAPVKAAEPAAAAQTDDTEIVAAIIAAIEAYRADEGLTGQPYRVVSFKKRAHKSSRTED